MRQHAGLLVQHRSGISSTFMPYLLHDKLDDAGINIAAAGTHGDAGQRGEAHGRILTFAVLRMAAREEPLPRWQLTILKSFRPSSAAARRATKRWDVPWKP